MNRKHKIDLSKILDKFDGGEITVREAGEMTSGEISKVKNSSPLLLSLRKYFKNVSTEEEYNDCLMVLYDYGDKYGISIKDW